MPAELEEIGQDHRVPGQAPQPDAFPLQDDEVVLDVLARFGDPGVLQNGPQEIERTLLGDLGRSPEVIVSDRDVGCFAGPEGEGQADETGPGGRGAVGLGIDGHPAGFIDPLGQDRELGFVGDRPEVLSGLPGGFKEIGQDRRELELPEEPDRFLLVGRLDGVPVEVEIEVEVAADGDQPAAELEEAGG